MAWAMISPTVVASATFGPVDIMRQYSEQRI